MSFNKAAKNAPLREQHFKEERQEEKQVRATVAELLRVDRALAQREVALGQGRNSAGPYEEAQAREDEALRGIQRAQWQKCLASMRALIM